MAKPITSDSSDLQEKLSVELRSAQPTSTESVSADLLGGFGAGSAGLPTAEAIIIADAFLRPALLVRNNTFEQPESTTWRSLLNAHRPKIDAAIRSVGRLELRGHPTFPYVGTAWMIAERIAITNRHVASTFAAKKGASFPLLKNPLGRQIEALVDFREEDRVATSNEIRIEKVLHISEPGDQNPDLALVQLEKNGPLPDPIPLFNGNVQKGLAVAVIGYPANDPRNPAAAVADVFGRVFEVKRLSPGMVTANPKGFLINHDASTLGGNSGSVLVHVETGQAVGLHFGGQFRQNNFAVESDELKKVLKRLKIQVSIPFEAKAEVKEEGPVPDLKEREGYAANFLGTKAALKVPLPTLGSNHSAATLKDGKGTELKYTHFSIVMNSRRRFAFFTAVNIDGNSSTNVRRANDKWFLDPRLENKFQVGNELYANNQLDRGHLVRRLDPVWGPDARQANDDTFFFTNATPQHARLNQGNWNDLEDYILTNTDAHDLKVNVFTGPVFGDDDPEYREVFLPQRFWKVVVVHNGKTKKLHATGYMLSQSDLLTNIEFVFGQFRTYQTPIREIERETGLKFGKLRNFDPIDKQETFAIREIVRLEDIQL